METPGNPRPELFRADLRTDSGRSVAAQHPMGIVGNSQSGPTLRLHPESLTVVMNSGEVELFVNHKPGRYGASFANHLRPYLGVWRVPIHASHCPPAVTLDDDIQIDSKWVNMNFFITSDICS